MGWTGKDSRASRAEPRVFARWFGNGRSWNRQLRRAAAVVFFLLLPAPVLLLLLFRFLPVPVTPEILLSRMSLQPTHQKWEPFKAISPALARAVIAAEDQNFCFHRGFDWKSIDDALKTHRRHPRRPLRGASTISQQTARTLFLLPVRSWVRKGLEAYLTVLLETLWPKKRILTAYLNLVDWGHGNYGAEAAAQAYFHKDASHLSGGESARLAAVLPNPDEWRVARPGPYVATRSDELVSRSDDVGRDGLDRCVKS
jgi:monofunctional biosynthetic peptidoglycan transglycosylase